MAGRLLAGRSEQQEDEITVLEEVLTDYGDLWLAIGPTERRDAVKTIFESVDQLQAAGLDVAACLTRYGCWAGLQGAREQH